MNIGDTIRDKRTAQNISATYIAKSLGVTKSAVYNWEQGIRTPDADTLKRLAVLLGCTVSELVGENAESSAVSIPILGDVSAGYPMFAEENIIGYEDISASMVTQGEYFALRINGDSMLPRMRKGDIVIVRRQSYIEDGQVAVVLVNGDSATVKVVHQRDDGLLLSPTNPDFPPLFYSAKSVQQLPVTIIGRVVELRAKYV